MALEHVLEISWNIPLKIIDSNKWLDNIALELNNSLIQLKTQAVLLTD